MCHNSPRCLRWQGRTVLARRYRECSWFSISCDSDTILRYVQLSSGPCNANERFFRCSDSTRWKVLNVSGKDIDVRGNTIYSTKADGRRYLQSGLLLQWIIIALRNSRQSRLLLIQQKTQQTIVRYVTIYDSWCWQGKYGNTANLADFQPDLRHIYPVW